MASRNESLLQRGVVALLRLHEKQGHLRFFAIPNGGLRSKIEAAIMQGEGVRAGVPDLVILFSTGDVMFVELKWADGKTSVEQRQWHAWLNTHKFPCFIVRDIGEMAGMLQEYLRRVA